MDKLGHVSEKVAIKHYQRIVAQHRNQIVNQLAEDFIKAANLCALFRVSCIDYRFRFVTAACGKLVSSLPQAAVLRI